MIKKLSFPLLQLLFLIPFSGFSQGYDPVDRVKDNMQAATLNLLEILDNEQREKVSIAYDDANRKDWNNLPTHSFARQGLSLGEMNDQQKIALHALLQTGLSTQGYLKARHIIRQDQQHRMDVFEEEGFDTDRTMYGHDYYYLSVFGNPEEDDNWGWRFEGHHLSLNFSLSPQGISVTPMFIGADPREILEGPYAGYSLLDEEADIAWRLINSLDEKQEPVATLEGKMPDDILTRTGDEPHTREMKGLAYSQMRPAQQDDLVMLVRAWVYNLNYHLAEQEMEKIREADLEELHFSWAGEKGQREPKYYRIHGPVTLIEYDNRTYEQWHIHSLWRNLSEDFGKQISMGK